MESLIFPRYVTLGRRRAVNAHWPALAGGLCAALVFASHFIAMGGGQDGHCDCLTLAAVKKETDGSFVTLQVSIPLRRGRRPTTGSERASPARRKAIKPRKYVRAAAARRETPYLKIIIKKVRSGGKFMGSLTLNANVEAGCAFHFFTLLFEVSAVLKRLHGLSRLPRLFLDYMP